MQGDLTATLAAWPAANAFLLVLTRVGGAVAFIPIPGMKNAPMLPKVFLAVALSLVLCPAWSDSNIPADLASSGISYLRCIAVEAAFGISVGVVVAWLNEALVIAMQVLATQAGYTYSSMIDPTTHADSGTLPVLAQLIAMLLFFSAGMDRAIIEAFGASLVTMPPGTFRVEASAAQAIIHHTSAMLTLAVRLALPLVALLLLVDLALALLGRLNSQLQLLALAMPAKMLVSLLVLASLASVLPTLYRQAGEGVMPLLWRLARIPQP